MPIDDAEAFGRELISRQHGRTVATPEPSELVAWTTRSNIGVQVAEAIRDYDNPDISTLNAVARIAATITDALSVHA